MGTIEREAGVAANLGKTHVYLSHGGPAPGIGELGDDALCGSRACRTCNAPGCCSYSLRLAGLSIPCALCLRPQVQSLRARMTMACGKRCKTCWVVALWARRAPAVLRGAAALGWARCWWGALAVAVPQATCSVVLGVWTMPALLAAHGDLPIAEIAGCRCDKAFVRALRIAVRLLVGGCPVPMGLKGDPANVSGMRHMRVEKTSCHIERWHAQHL